MSDVTTKAVSYINVVYTSAVKPDHIKAGNGETRSNYFRPNWDSKHNNQSNHGQIRN